MTITINGSGTITGATTLASTIASPTMTGAIVSAMGSSVITSGTAVASTSGTSIDFTSLPSWIKRITVMFSGVSTSGTSQYLVQLGDSGGIENTGYVSTSVGTTGSGGSNYSSTAGFILASDQASYLVSGHIVITNITGTSWVASGVGKEATTAIWMSGGNKTLSDTLDRVRITTVNGTDTFDAGSINILYE